jgi:N-acetylglucosamine-6-sulfatase
VDPTTYNYFGFTTNDDGRLTHYPPSPASYSTDVLARKATGLITAAARGPRPFFLWTAFLAPHFSLSPFHDPDDPPGFHTPTPAPQDRNRFAWAPLPRPPSFDEADVSDKPTEIQSYPRLNGTIQSAIQENYQQELGTLQGVDRAVGQIVETLRRTGQLGRTLIIFTSDNGYFHGEHRIPREKIVPYEPAIRVPLIVSGPGLPQGVPRSQLVSNQDLAPTILAATGARPDRGALPRALRDLRRGQDQALVLRRVLGRPAGAVRPRGGPLRAREPRPTAPVRVDRSRPGRAAREPARLQRRLVPGPPPAPRGPAGPPRR